ncbi:MAG: GtrA family protein [Candidatus Parcubacteria bacterium]|nr:GtrA family protein [Candidatus Parcubacteria bacterium]
MTNNTSLKKTDILLALFIGEICAWLMILIGKNLGGENPAILALLSYFKYLPVVFPVLCLMGLLVAYFLGKAVPTIYQLAKFILVGGLNFLIDMGVLNFLIFATGISTGIIQSGFKAVSFLLAVLNSYLGNKYWAFKRTTQESVFQEFFQFLIVSVIGFALNLTIDYILVNTVGPLGNMTLKTWAQISALLSALVLLAWNFLGYKFIVFNTKNEK